MLESVSSWKLEISATATESSSASPTTEVMGRPTLPHGTHRSPAARKIAPSMATVVVFPFVPVTATSGARRSRQPSSASPTIALPARRKSTGSGWSIGMPGLSTSTSHARTPSSPPLTARAPAARRARACSLSNAAGRSSYRYTAAPRASRRSAAAIPLRDSPATRNFCVLKFIVSPSPETGSLCEICQTYYFAKARQSRPAAAVISE